MRHDTFALRAPEAFLARPRWAFDLIAIYIPTEDSDALSFDLATAHDAEIDAELLRALKAGE